MFDDPVVDAFARDVREAAASTPAPVPCAALATILRDGLPPMPGADRAPARKRARRRRGALRGAVAGLVAGLGVGGLGVAGALPDPVQRQVVRAAKVIGVELPAPDGAGDVEIETELPDDAPVAPSPAVVDTEVPPPGSTPAVTAPGQIEEDDDAPGRGRGRGRGGDERDDRAGDAGIETTTTPAPAGPPPGTVDDDDLDDDEQQVDDDADVDVDVQDEDGSDDDGLDGDRRGRNRGARADSPGDGENLG